jgi:hypothetical protein
MQVGCVDMEVQWTPDNQTPDIRKHSMFGQICVRILNGRPSFLDHSITRPVIE